jgi:simple sugar transport system permease protein
MSSQVWRRQLEAICLPTGAVLFALVLFGGLCALAEANPFEVYALIYKAAFGSASRIQGTLILAAPLMLSALCTALPAKLGLVIIGNEGSLVLGGIAATIAGLTLAALPPALVVLLMAIAGMVAGGLWIALVGALRHYRGVNETISGLLMNYIAIALLNHLAEGPLRDPSYTSKPSSFPLLDANRLGEIPGTRVHWGLVYGLVTCAIAYLLIQRTTFGFAARTAGGNIRAARIAGLPVGQLTVAICFLAGSCTGLAGMVEVSAIHARLNASLNADYGYSGILVAFIARNNALAVTLVAFLLGGILGSGGILQRNYELPDATILVFQGILFLAILFSESLYGKIPFFKERTAPPPDRLQPQPQVTA